MLWTGVEAQTGQLTRPKLCTIRNNKIGYKIMGPQSNQYYIFISTNVPDSDFYLIDFLFENFRYQVPPNQTQFEN